MIIVFILGLINDLFWGNRLGGTSLVLVISCGLILWLRQKFNFSREIKLNEPE